MIQATIKGFDRFPEVDADIERLVVVALDGAAEAAAAAAQDGSHLRLELEVSRAEPTVDGYTTGIKSRRRGKDGSYLAVYYDKGTLGQRRGPLKARRHQTWSVTRKGTSYTAHRHAIDPDEGIPAEGFFATARRIGKKVLIDRIDRGV